MRGMNADNTGRLLRRIFKNGSGHRSILRIGPSGEIGSSMACINVDTYRHFGRMGGGATMGAKNLKGIVFADRALLRNGACAGCPVGCIHIGYIREKAKADNRYHYHQVAYDYEPIFAAGTMLGVTDCFGVLRILDDSAALGSLADLFVFARWSLQANGELT